MSAVSCELAELSSNQRLKNGVRLTSKKSLDGVTEAKIDIEYQLNQLAGKDPISSSGKIEYNPVLLCELIKQYDLESVKKMIKYNKDRINDLINDNETALFVAVKHGFPDIVRFLLKNGADPNIKSVGYTPLLYICVYPGKIHKEFQLSIIKTLIEFGADLNEPYDTYIIDRKEPDFRVTLTPITEILKRTQINLDILEVMLENDIDLTTPVLTYCLAHEESIMPTTVRTFQSALFIAVLNHPENKNVHDALLSKIRDYARKNVPVDVNQEKYSQGLKNYILKFSATDPDLFKYKKVMELLLTEVYEPLMLEYQQKSTFLMGLDSRLSSMTAIGSESFAKNSIFERQLIPLIFQYALTPSKKLEVPKKTWGSILFDGQSVETRLWLSQINSEAYPGPEYTVNPVTGMFIPRIKLKPLPLGGMSIFSQGTL